MQMGVGSLEVSLKVGVGWELKIWGELGRRMRIKSQGESKAWAKVESPEVATKTSLIIISNDNVRF